MRKKIESQTSINEWQRQTFPDATIEGVIGHLKEEFHEFVTADTPHEAALEAADLVILLYCWAMMNNVDLHASIDAKMSINRSRSWNLRLDGTGRHT